MLTLILDGGPIMWPLLLLSIMVVAVIIDRWRAFAVAGQDTERVRSDVLGALGKDDLASAIEACQENTGPLAAVTQTGLARYRSMLLHGKTDPVQIEAAVSDAMEEYAPRALAGLERRLNLLALIATASPLLGMTGTVTGMIKSFDKMREAAGLDPSAVAGGISEALITTAAGLIIALPALVAYNLFSRQIETSTLTMEEMIHDIRGFITEQSVSLENPIDERSVSLENPIDNASHGH